MFHHWEHSLLKPSGVKTGRNNEDDLREENEIFL